MDSATRLPAATASITAAGPEALSPPAKTPSIEVCPVTGSALKQPAIVFDADMADKLLINHLADGDDNLVRVNRYKFVFIKCRTETFLVIENPCAAFELYAFY